MKKFILIAVFIASAQLSFAQAICPINGKGFTPKGVSSVDSFASIAVLDGGRTKPLETYAENLLLQFSGRRAFEKKSAAKWLARLLMSPEMTRDDKIFLINNPALVESLGIEVEKKRRYSFSQLEEPFEKIHSLATAAQAVDSKKRDVVESEIIRLYENLKIYSLLSLSYSFIFPHPDFTVEDEGNIKNLELEKYSGQTSYLDLAVRADRLQALVAPLEHLPESAWTDGQQELMRIIASLYGWTQSYQRLPFKIIPAYETDSEEWLSPWDAMTIALADEQGRQELSSLRSMVIAYWNGEQLEFDLATKSFSRSIEARLGHRVHPPKDTIALERLYNKLNLLGWCYAVYLIIFFVFLFSLIFKFKNSRPFAFGLIVAAFALHAVAILMRMAILQRPPVSNLYETFLFVGFVCVLTGILIERIQKAWLGIVIAAICGGTFLSIARKFAAEGDTLQMLIAVLNSNFWLSTHVLSITIGYAGVCVAGIVGHVYLIQAAREPNKKDQLQSTYRILLGTLGFGLTMTFLGTNLGGIWADQSWGRFWGWDPKENGALLIIIWVAMLFHAKIAKIIGPLGLAIGAGLGIIVVVWAWFGVNLLSIGLHSYGFTSGLATNLAIYFVCQIIVLVVLGSLARKKLKNS